MTVGMLLEYLKGLDPNMPCVTEMYSDFQFLRMPEIIEVIEHRDLAYLERYFPRQWGGVIPQGLRLALHFEGN